MLQKTSKSVSGGRRSSCFTKNFFLVKKKFLVIQWGTRILRTVHLRTDLRTSTPLHSRAWKVAEITSYSSPNVPNQQSDVTWWFLCFKSRFLEFWDICNRLIRRLVQEQKRTDVISCMHTSTSRCFISICFRKYLKSAASRGFRNVQRLKTPKSNQGIPTFCP